MQAADVLLVIAEISVALVGFTGIIAVFRQRGISSWQPQTAYRFKFMCWNAFNAMAFALVPFVPYNVPEVSAWTWQISSTLFALANLSLVWLTWSGARNLPPEFASQLSRGWMITYQSGSLIMVALLLANAFCLLDAAGPAMYLRGLGWQLFLAASLFVRLMLAPNAATD